MDANIFSRIGPRNGRARGQSIVEFTLVLPILLLIVAGTLEVGNVLTNYNRTQLAAREAARFGAAGGSDLGIIEIIEDASEQALIADPDQMTVWIIRPTIATGGSPDPNNWYWDGSKGGGPPWGVPENCQMGDACGSLPNPLTPAEVIEETGQAMPLNPDWRNQIDGTTFVVVVIRYEVETVLNLPFFTAPGQEADAGGGNDRIPVWAYEALVQEIDTETITQLQSGCSAYPLILNGTALLGPGGEQPEEGDTFDLYLDYIADPNNPAKWNLGGFGITAWNRNNIETDDITRSCNNPKPGSICSSTVSLRDDIGFTEYDPFNPDDNSDTELHREDWVLTPKSINVPNVQQDLNDDFAETGEYMRVMVYYLDPDPPLVGGDPDSMNDPRYIEVFPESGPSSSDWLWQYQVADFAIIRILEGGVLFSGSASEDDHLQFEFIRWDRSCGYDS